MLAVAHDPRIKTCLIFNSGIGEMSMSGASKESLANLHQPMLYLNGGTADVAYENANGDWKRIKELPVVKISTLDGHHGTYYEKNAGAYAPRWTATTARTTRRTPAPMPSHAACGSTGS